jgi:hypothetical protein
MVVFDTLRASTRTVLYLQAGPGVGAGVTIASDTARHEASRTPFKHYRCTRGA